MKRLFWLFIVCFCSTTAIASIDHVLDEAEIFVLFIGYPRSGHSIVGACLNAHPHMALSHEYGFFYRDFNADPKHTLYKLWSRSMLKFPGRDYEIDIPGDCQGRYETFLKVIGDKSGGSSANLLAGDFDRLFNNYRKFVKAIKKEGKWTHVQRNPFDNIATLFIRSKIPGGDRYFRFRKNPEAKFILKGASRKEMISEIKVYFRRAQSAKRLMDAGEQVKTFYVEDFIRDPKKELKVMCAFLSVSASDDYLETCAKCVSTKESRTHEYIEWDEKLIQMINEEMRKYPFMERYYDSIPSSSGSAGM